jgi:rhodanese-related sulfurtransferase
LIVSFLSMNNLQYKNRFAFSLLGMASLFAACGVGENSGFQLTAEETLQKAAPLGYVISRAEFETWSQEEKGNLLLIDLRAPIEFDRGHLPNAVNIPAAHLLDDSSLKLLAQSPATVLYHESASGANGPWLMLAQLGFENIKILHGAYADTTALPAPETARYDYAAIFQTAIERHQKELEAGKLKAAPAQAAPAVPKATPGKKAIVPEKKAEPKKVQEEEGC